MYQLRYLEQAKTDLLSIQRYIAKQSGSSKTAFNYTGTLRQKCKELASIKGRVGRSRPELGETIRSHAIGNYVIFFQYNNDLFEIITIIEGHRDIEAIFENEILI